MSPCQVADGPDVRIASVVFRLLKEHPDCIDLCDLYLGRHGQQVESLCRQVLLRGPFAHIVEVGAGKGLLGRVPRFDGLWIFKRVDVFDTVSGVLHSLRNRNSEPKASQIRCFRSLCQDPL